MCQNDFSGQAPQRSCVWIGFWFVLGLGSKTLCFCNKTFDLTHWTCFLANSKKTLNNNDNVSSLSGVNVDSRTL